MCALLVGVTGCSLLVEGTPSQDENRPETRRQIHLGAGIDGLVVPVVLNDDEHLAAADVSAINLGFEGAGGQVLAHETELFDGDTGDLVAWVRTPPGASEFFVVCGGDVGTTTEDVWGDDFLGVWHLGDGPTLFADSTRHRNVAVAADDSTRPTSAPGVVGAGLEFDGVDDLVTIGDPADGSLDPAGSFSYAVWVEVEQSSGASDNAWYKGGENDSTPGYRISLGADFWSASVSDGTRRVTALLGPEPDFLGKRMHLVAVVDRATGTLTVYANGIFRNSEPLDGLGSLATDRLASLSRATGSGNRFRGRIDEVRVYATALGADRVAAEYAAVADSTFVTIDDPE